ncbi:hypothetical protein LCGC14_0827880 [marine sediment metagenome]|uniref:Uncharacterized protein n=1 Tax=marine sediment metagenome TaxID=412755 RepID=A0A0F9SP78_9ZZZZ
MKRRNGFVSNSSSSNFIIATRRIEPCPVCNRTDMDFLEAIDAAHGLGSSVEQRGYQEVLDYMKEELDDYGITIAGGTKLETWQQSTLDCYVELRDGDWDGWELARLDLDRHDQVLKHLLRQGVASGSIRMLSAEDD